nr:MAG TPA: hypothetical protein [Caudoviricetes sp.]
MYKTHIRYLLNRGKENYRCFKEKWLFLRIYQSTLFYCILILLC